jgi:Protein of unknown function (DUF1153)
VDKSSNPAGRRWGGELILQAYGEFIFLTPRRHLLYHIHRAGNASPGLLRGIKMATLNLNADRFDLPSSDTIRWSPHRKASVVRGLRSGAISLDEACRRYQLSAGEFLAWQEAIEAHGIGALRVTRSQLYRAGG